MIENSIKKVESEKDITEKKFKRWVNTRFVSSKESLVNYKINA